MEKNTIVSLVFTFLAAHCISVHGVDQKPAQPAVKTEQIAPAPQAASKFINLQDIKAFVAGMNKRDYALVAGGAVTAAVLYYIVSSVFADEDEDFDFE